MLTGREHAARLEAAALLQSPLRPAALSPVASRRASLPVGCARVRTWGQGGGQCAEQGTARSTPAQPVSPEWWGRLGLSRRGHSSM